jgi:hypothetical protein
MDEEEVRAVSNINLPFFFHTSNGTSAERTIWPDLLARWQSG